MDFFHPASKKQLFDEAVAVSSRYNKTLKRNLIQVFKKIAFFKKEPIDLSFSNSFEQLVFFQYFLVVRAKKFFRVSENQQGKTGTLTDI